ncbi:MAG TPA: alpha/beta hydrolase [Hyphomicrobiales bacterium]|nr:alpha/beta hydrolase [Hyphomicrobiales bacterium]
MHTRLYKRIAIAALLAASALGASAQDVTDPLLLDAFAKLKAMGPNLTPQVIDETGKLFAEIHQHSDKGDLALTADVHYGPDAKQVMDVYTPRGASGKRPVVVFIHGGGLTGGDKVNPLSSLMNANVATYFGRHDMVGINATYRLVPNITYPQGAEDMQAIVGWIRDNADAYGIDPDKIFFLCSSAGCTHVSALLYNPDVMFEGDPDIAGAIMLSGAYQAGNADYFGSDAALQEQRSTYALADAYQGPRVPVFLMSAELDPPAIEQGTAQLYLQLCGKYANCPRFAQARDHNHISINQHINTSDDRYTRMMVDFIEEVSGAK